MLAAYVVEAAADNVCPWCGRLLRPGHIEAAYRVPPARGGQWQTSNVMGVCTACARSHGDTNRRPAP